MEKIILTIRAKRLSGILLKPDTASECLKSMIIMKSLVTAYLVKTAEAMIVQNINKHSTTLRFVLVIQLLYKEFIVELSCFCNGELGKI